MTTSPTITPAKKNEEKRELLPMEKEFNKRAYGGISYFAQAFTGSALTYWMKFAGGRPIYDKIARWLGPNLISKFTHLRGAEAVKGADAFITVSTMVMMGNLFLIPLKWMEDKKAEIVERWTHQDNVKREGRGEVITPEEKAHQQELLEQLKATPKQTWWSLGLGRTFSLATVYSTLFALDKVALNDKMEKTFSGGVKWAADKIGLKQLAKSKTFGNVLNIGFFEGFYSAISAGGLFVYSHFVVPPKEAPVVAHHDIPTASDRPATLSAHEPSRTFAAHARKPESFVERQQQRATEQPSSHLQMA